MFYLEKQHNGLFVWETDPECDTILHLIRQISNSTFTQEKSYYRYGVDIETTTIANIRNNLIAVSENYNSIIGAACMEMI